MLCDGWELPYHPLQVITISVFLALGFVFFVLLVSFVGSDLMKIVVSSVYAPLMACDSSDPAVLLRAKKSCASMMTLSSISCEENMLYCKLCKVEILKSSKHCRLCDKCVDCFDHHCRLIVEWGVGVWVIVRFLQDQRRFEHDVSSTLGNSFSVVPFVCGVGICTLLTTFATLPLGQLYLFHALLMWKGMSTYDYMLAMRECDRQQKNGGSGKLPPTPHASPASGVTTAMSSGASSIGTLDHAPWCTPPRLFVDHEQTPPIQLDRLKSIDSELTAMKPYPEKKEKKAIVKLSPWAVARLNPEDAFHAFAEACKNCSMLRLVQQKAEATTTIETDNNDDSVNYVN